MKSAHKIRLAVPVEEPNRSNRLADLNSTFKWTSGSDVQLVWRKYGWRPPSEYRTDYLFATNRDV